MAYGLLYGQCPQCHDPIIVSTFERVFCPKCKIGVDPKAREALRARVLHNKAKQSATVK